MIDRMRMLFTFTGGNGHFRPLVPVARAAGAQGHEVLFACQPAMMRSVAAAGFPVVDSGGRTLAAPDARSALLRVDRHQEEDVIRNTFAGSVARERADRLLGLASDWKPDVIVRDEVDFGAAVVAERLGIAHVSVIVLAAGGLVRPDVVAESLNALRAEHRLAPDPELAMLHRYLSLVPVAPSFRTPADPLPATARHIQPAVLEPRPVEVPPDGPGARTLSWLAENGDRPTVYFTLGTVFHQESGDLFPRVLAALSTLEASVVVTLGHEIEPAELGPQPDTVRVEHFIPQEILLPHCDALVCHAGSGSIIGALAFGIPQVLLPMGADQPLNADRCEALGVGQVLDPIDVSGDEIIAAVKAVLEQPGFRHAAQVIEQEIAELPTAATAARWIAALTAGGALA